MVQINSIFLLIFFITSLRFTDPERKNDFIPPLKIPIAFSSNFGELRVDHFHSGLDFKTQGVTGKEVVAAASGYVYRISVTPGGFGNALYITHPTGYSTVYGHLDKFIPQIEKYVKDQQYGKKSFQVTLFPPKEMFIVKQGEIIGYSGNSGSSAGPHLHYEIREAETEIPVNPLLFDFGAKDNIRPVIQRLFIYPVGRNSSINGKNGTIKLNAEGGNGKYTLPGDSEMSISGSAGFGIQSYDLLDGSTNKCSVHSIEVRVDSSTVFRYVMDRFSFNESRYINSHIDYETYMRENTYIERTFLLPNDRLKVYQDVVNRGIIKFEADVLHRIEIIVSDIHRNRAVLSFYVKGAAQSLSTPARTPEKGMTLMPYNKSNRFAADDISVSIPSGALYDTLLFSYKRDTGTPFMLSDVHYVHNKYVPLHKSYRLSIKPQRIIEGKESKMLILQIDDNMKKSALTSAWSEGFIHAEATTFGMFYVGIDTISPVITPVGFQSGTDMTGRKEIRIRITDELAGIRSFVSEIDGKWALFEYDQKNDMLIYEFDSKRISGGSNHTLTLKVTDNKDNYSVYDCNFIW